MIENYIYPDIVSLSLSHKQILFSIEKFKVCEYEQINMDSTNLSVACVVAMGVI